jgi:hypothetical protein
LGSGEKEHARGRFVPDKHVTNELRFYAAAPLILQYPSATIAADGANNRPENLHQQTRRERKM